MRPISFYADLSDPRRRREHGFFMVEGPRAIGQIIAFAPSSVDEVLVTEESAPNAASPKFPCPVRTLTVRQFKSISASTTPQGIAAVVRIPEGTFEARLPKVTGERVVLLEGVQDPGNVGALVRTAAAFDYNGIILSGECADPFAPKAVQASAGSVLAIWVRRTSSYSEIAKTLQARGYSLIAADPRGETMVSGCFRRKHVIMLGSEGNGLGDGLLSIADCRIRIPMNDKKAESFNVAIAGSIMMYAGAMTG